MDMMQTILERKSYRGKYTAEPVPFNTLPEGCVWMRNNGFSEKEIESASPIFTIGICKKCGDYLYPSFLNDYACQCFTCDEDFYCCEQEIQTKEVQ